MTKNFHDFVQDSQKKGKLNQVKLKKQYWQIHQNIVDFHQGILLHGVRESHHLQILPFGIELEAIHQSNELITFIKENYFFGIIYSFRLVIDSILAGEMLTGPEDLRRYIVYDYKLVQPVWQLSRNNCQIMNQEYLDGIPQRLKNKYNWQYTTRECIQFN